jgi:hypothetical protein
MSGRNATPKPDRAAVISGWIIDEFKDDTQGDVAQACVRVLSGICTYNAGSSAQALVLARAFSQQIELLTREVMKTL